MADFRCLIWWVRVNGCVLVMDMVMIMLMALVMVSVRVSNVLNSG